MVPTWQPTSVVLLAHLLELPPSPSSQVIITTVDPPRYSRLRRIRGRFLASHGLQRGPVDVWPCAVTWGNARKPPVAAPAHPAYVPRCRVPRRSFPHSQPHRVLFVPHSCGASPRGPSRCYQRLARATEVPVQIQGRPDRAWIVVSVPASGNQRDVAATMDAARALIAEADAAQRVPATAQAEGIVRDWWAGGRESAARRPISKVETVRTGIGVEKRWPLLGALALAIAVPLLLPSRFSLGPDWIVPAVVALLLVAIFVANRARGGWAAVVPGAGGGLRRSSRTSLSPSSSTRTQLPRAGAQDSSTSSTSVLPMPPRSARPM